MDKEKKSIWLARNKEGNDAYLVIGHKPIYFSSKGKLKFDCWNRFHSDDIMILFKREDLEFSGYFEYIFEMVQPGECVELVNDQIADESKERMLSMLRDKMFIGYDLSENCRCIAVKTPIPSDCFTQMIEDAIKDGRLT